jgi:hypothetical protein
VAGFAFSALAEIAANLRQGGEPVGVARRLEAPEPCWFHRLKTSTGFRCHAGHLLSMLGLELAKGRSN